MFLQMVSWISILMLNGLITKSIGGKWKPNKRLTKQKYARSVILVTMKKPKSNLMLGRDLCLSAL